MGDITSDFNWDLVGDGDGSKPENPWDVHIKIASIDGWSSPQKKLLFVGIDHIDPS